MNIAVRSVSHTVARWTRTSADASTSSEVPAGSASP